MKNFLLIANKNCVTYKEFFPYIKDRIVNIGYTNPGDFDQPDDVDYKSLQGLTRWFTTLSTASKPPLVLTATYSPEKYKRFDNYDAINVDRVQDIPWDYDGVMGVPITILGYDLNNVEIIGDKTINGKATKINGKEKYRRVLIKKNFEIDGCLYGDHTIIDGTYIKGHTPEIDGKHKYTRVLIKTTNPKGKIN